MSGNFDRSNKIRVQLIVRDDCPYCRHVQKDLQRYCQEKEFISLELVDLDNGGRAPGGKQMFITPAVWVNDKLWSLGEFDVARFHERVRQLVNNTST